MQNMFWHRPQMVRTSPDRLDIIKDRIHEFIYPKFHIKIIHPREHPRPPSMDRWGGGPREPREPKHQHKSKNPPAKSDDT